MKKNWSKIPHHQKSYRYTHLQFKNEYIKRNLININYLLLLLL